MRFYRLLTGILLFASTLLTAQQATFNWQANAFRATAFVENKGQFAGTDVPADARFSYRLNGGELFFTPNGLAWRYAKPAEQQEPLTAKQPMRVITATLDMNWVGANTQPELLATEQATDYNMYPMPGAKAETIRAAGFRMLTYKNLYPGIDLVYRIHKDDGIKYELVVHPGADASKIRMRYSGNPEMELDRKGNLRIRMDAGTITDHAPVSFYSDAPSAKNKISSAFQLTGNEVSFALGTYDHTRTLVIDPWQVSPSFLYLNKAFDITHDGSGNVFAYGGASPFQLKKFTATGTPLWTYTNTGLAYYGDFCLDPAGNAYLLTMGSNSNELVKVSPAGTTIFTQPPQNNQEQGRYVHRIAYNGVTGKLVVAGYQVIFSPWMPTSQAVLYEVNPATGIQSNDVYFSGTPRVGYCALQIDTTDGKIYTLGVNCDPQNTSLQSNRLFCYTAAHAPVYNMPSGYDITANQPYYNYYNGMMLGNYCGINAIALGCYVYTWDGRKLTRMNKTSGAMIDSVIVPGGTTTMQSGICLDKCGNVYIGTVNAILQYDAGLNLLQTIAMSGDVYDIQQGNANNELLVAGTGYIASITINLNCSSGALPIVSQGSPASSCTCNGTASVTNTDPCNTAGPLTYQWLQLNQFSNTVTGLCPGTYTCVVTAVNSGIQDTITVTVGVTANSVNVSAIGSSPTCPGCTDGSLLATPAGGTPPFTYLWLPGGNTTPQIASAGAGTYTVLITDAQGCTDTAQVTLTEPVDPVGIIIPNVFTPNNDHINDVFKLDHYGIVNITWQVYDRWGSLVFETDNPNKVWYGNTSDDKPCSAGTYYYAIRILGVDDKIYTRTGFVTLIR